MIIVVMMTIMMIMMMIMMVVVMTTTMTTTTMMMMMLMMMRRMIRLFSLRVLTRRISVVFSSFIPVRGIFPVKVLEADCVIVGRDVVCNCSLWSASFSEHRCKSVTGYTVVAFPSNC